MECIHELLPPKALGRDGSSRANWGVREELRVELKREGVRNLRARIVYLSFFGYPGTHVCEGPGRLGKEPTHLCRIVGAITNDERATVRKSWCQRNLRG